MVENDGRTRNEPVGFGSERSSEPREPSRDGPTGPTGGAGGPGRRPRGGSPAEQGKERIANRLDQAGRQLKRRGDTLEKQGGVKRRAGQAAERAGELAERGASYLRTQDMDEMRTDLEVRVRDRPLASVAIALGAGYIIGRLFG